MQYRLTLLPFLRLHAALGPELHFTVRMQPCLLPMRGYVPNCCCCGPAGIRLSTFDTAKKILTAAEAALEQELAKED